MVTGLAASNTAIHCSSHTHHVSFALPTAAGWQLGDGGVKLRQLMIRRAPIGKAVAWCVQGCLEAGSQAGCEWHLRVACSWCRQCSSSNASATTRPHAPACMACPVCSHTSPSTLVEIRLLPCVTHQVLVPLRMGSVPAHGAVSPLKQLLHHTELM